MKRLMGQDIDNIQGVFNKKKLLVNNRNDLLSVLKISELDDFFVEGGIGVFRHGKTLDNIDGEDKPKGILVELDKSEFTEEGSIVLSIKKLQELGFTKENIHIYTANDTKRINQTLQIICKELGIEFDYQELGEIESNKYITIDNRFSARKKGKTAIDSTITLNIAGDVDMHGQESLLQTMNRAATGIYDLQQRESCKNNLLLVVGYRTSIGGFEHKLEGKKLKDKTIEADFAQLKIQGLTSKKEVLKSKNLYAFRFDINLFLKELDLWNNEIFGKTQKNIDFTLFDWQNRINLNIENLEDENKKKIFSFILKNNIFTSNMISFSLLNLIKLGKKEIIISNIKTLLWNEEVKEVLDNLINTDEDENITKLAKEVMLEIEFHESMELHYKENIYPIVKEIRNRSLDVRVRNGEDINPKFNLGKDYANILEILDTDSQITIIEGLAGTGKSFLLSEINQALQRVGFQMSDKKIFPIYINLSGKNIDEIKEDIDKLATNNKFGLKMILILDSLDESLLFNEEMEGFISYLQSIDSKVLLTSRPGYIKKQENVNILGLHEFNNDEVEEYASKYLGVNQEKIAIFQKMMSEDWLYGIENNPLILSMICEVINGANYEFSKPLEDIKSKSDLYDAIVCMRLYNWNEGVNDRRVVGQSKNKTISDKRKIINIEKRKELLYKIAYKSLVLRNSLSEEEIYEMEEAENIENLECLNLIYKKDRDGAYGFIHESFREYFAANAYIIAMEKGDINHKNLILNFLDKMPWEVFRFFYSGLDENKNNYDFVYALLELTLTKNWMGKYGIMSIPLKCLCFLLKFDKNLISDDLFKLIGFHDIIYLSLLDIDRNNINFLLENKIFRSNMHSITTFYGNDLLKLLLELRNKEAIKFLGLFRYHKDSKIFSIAMDNLFLLGKDKNLLNYVVQEFSEIIYGLENYKDLMEDNEVLYQIIEFLGSCDTKVAKDLLVYYSSKVIEYSEKIQSYYTDSYREYVVKDILEEEYPNGLQISSVKLSESKIKEIKEIIDSGTSGSSFEELVEFYLDLNISIYKNRYKKLIKMNPNAIISRYGSGPIFENREKDIMIDDLYLNFLLIENLIKILVKFGDNNLNNLSQKLKSTLSFYENEKVREFSLNLIN